MELNDAPLLRIEKLVFAYGQRWLFEGFNAQAGAGVTWVQGANGSGKSTLLRLLAGALAPRHGHFELDGCRFAAGDRIAPLAWRQQTFWCLSDPPPTPWLTIAECLGFVSGADALADAQALREQVDALGLAKALATPLRDASLGQQRKTLLALALALPVKLLLLDEPFNALDVASARHLSDTLTARAAQGAQVILLTSHVEPHVPVRDTWVLG
ncbi:MAG: ATP-binding cassette domain-containing protein [Betaproteobacteria bacterium]